MKPIISLMITVFFCALILMPSQINVLGRDLHRPAINLKPLGINFARDLEFKLGLDLQGGSHLSYQADMSKIDPQNRPDALNSLKSNIERRINLLGVAETSVQTAVAGDSYRLNVDLPGVKDINQALNVIGATAFLDFRLLDFSSPSAQASTTSAQSINFVSTGLTGSDLKSASVQFGATPDSLGRPSVAIVFHPAGAEKFSRLTKDNLGKRLAIFLDNQLLTDPVIQSEITNGQAVITGDFSLAEAKALSVQLNAGALPVPITLLSQKSVEASLGAESVAKSLVAGAIGLIVIWAFMIGNYGLKGVFASLTLTVYVLISLSIFKLIPVTLTLAGIAGFILSVGMAVDANILIFERMREEIRWGRPAKIALELGFQRAWSSIRDSNVSSCITAAILFWFGTGPVRGFALTLLIGVLVSLLTAVSFTRSLLRLNVK